jgi:cell division protein FtsQ
MEESQLMMRMKVNNSSFSAHGGVRDMSRTSESSAGKVSSNSISNKSYTGLLILLLIFSVGILLIQNYAVITRYLNKPIRVVLMENSIQSVNERNVRAVLAAHLDAGFFGIDVRAIKRELENDPWVDQVIITRNWPDTLSVAIIEEVAIARWGDADLLNQYGESFTPESVAVDIGLPVLRGPDGSARRVMEQYQVFSQMLSASGIRIKEIELSHRGSWIISLNGGQVVTVGRNDVLERIERFIVLHDRHLYTEMDSIEAFDLRYNNGVSIRKKPVVPNGVASK